MVRSAYFRGVSTRLPSLRRPPIAFAHRGASAHAPDNTIQAFHLALRLGATGLESDVWLTADGAVVLDHDGLVRRRLRRRPVGELPRRALPPHVPTLDELYAECGTAFELSLDVKDPRSVDRVLTIAHAAGAASRLWLCHPDAQRLRSWRALSADARLVQSTRLRRLRGAPERWAADLQSFGIDAVNLHESEWTGGLTTLVHRFGRYTFGWDAQFERQIEGLLDLGIDGVYGDHVDRMVDALARLGPC